MLYCWIFQVDSASYAEKYELELIAGDFYRIQTTEASLDMLCEYTQCVGFQFPYDVPGVNDVDQCDTNLLQYLD